MFHPYWRYACANASGSLPRHHHRPTSRTCRDRSAMYTWATGPAFGVRRPLRHLSWKLDLTEGQIREMADVLNRLKTAYAQARLDRERSLGDIAASFDTDVFDAEVARRALDGRQRASTTLNDEVLKALEKIFASLDEDQRREFAYLLRSGEFQL